MRRGINIRKKKKIVFKEINKKSLKLLSLLTLILILCISIYFFFIKDFLIISNLDQDSINFSTLNEHIPFSLQKILLFSSATAESDSLNQQLSLNISQYCDIGIYLNKVKDNSVLISSLYIDDISISSPEIGTPCLYKKAVSDLGKCSFDENNIINKTFNFNAISNDSEINHNNYEIYSNASTPISLGFYNKNIKTRFIPDDSEIIYNGTLLKKAMIPLTSLNCNVSFTINIITTSNEHYICNVNFDIPFENNNDSIYTEGYITKEINTNDINKFIRIK